ncbi:hypothetical protein Bca52824_036311 [Brassica carinata]|uniref:IBR domain-containing protein n=1 Tax=Brassica carinata TaxID=52824 RepID=A0A8X7S3N8_BRACI|nr:hypothetical protein Bca52824_036311 [Brassica carinata]
MIPTRTRNHGGGMGFHRGSATGATEGKLSEKPHFHKLYSKGLMTMKKAPKMETRRHEGNTCLTLMDAETRALTRDLAEATKVKKQIARLRDDAQTMRRRLRSSNLFMGDGTYLESAHKVITEPETTRDLYLLSQANEAMKAGLGVAGYDKKDNLVLNIEGQLHDPHHGKKKESCVICFDDYIDSDLMFSLLEGTLPNCLQHGCTAQLSVDRCDKLLTPDMSLKWREMAREDSVPFKERFYCPYKSCSYLMKCLKCRGSFCFYCKARWHSTLSCTEYKKLHSDIQNANLFSLAYRNGWRQCGKCHHMVERSSGCRYMTCR